MFIVSPTSSREEQIEKVAPERDTVVPFRFFDDTPLWRAFILYSMFVYDEVLDVDKLRDSLERLVRREGWRKLGARLRIGTKGGGLEYHMPSTFTADRPAISFSCVEHDMPASAHHVASRIPKPSIRPAIVCDPDEFRSLFLPHGAPTKLEDYLTRDIPQVGLHAVSFTDRTILSMYWPHTLMDAISQSNFLNSWSLVLAGRDSEVPVPMGGDLGPDPLADVGTQPTEPHKLGPRKMSMFGLASYGLGQALGFFRQQENRMVCVPASFIKALHAQATVELRASRPHDDRDPFLTDGDVLVAWWTRIATLHLPRTSQRTIVLNNAYSMRKALGFRADQPYVSNCVGFLNVLLPAQDIFRQPLGEIALRMRQAVNQLGTREQVEAFAALWRSSSAKLPPFFGDAGMLMLTFSNWTKARLFEADFSAAVVGARDEGKSCVPVYVQGNQFGLALPNGFPIIGKDIEGNYWLSGYMNRGQWERIERDLALCPANGAEVEKLFSTMLSTAVVKIARTFRT